VSDLALLLQGFFTDKLMRQRQASPHTVAAYRDTFTLLLGFVAQRTGRQAAQLGLADLDAPTIGAFLQHLEADRHNTAATRNARLAAVRSLFRYAAPRAPDHAALIQRVLAIPTKRFDRAIVSFLTPAETDALLQAPDRTTWTGRRDHALLLVALHTGLRVLELVGLRLHDVQLGTGPHLRCRGKGRKDRCTPLTTPTGKVLRAWLAERGGQHGDPLFPPAAAPHSAATPCSAWSPSTPPPQRCAARRCCKRG
jgi:integrase/recombinase XerD